MYYFTLNSSNNNTNHQLTVFKNWFTNFILSILFINLFMLQYIKVTYSIIKFSNEIYGYLSVIILTTFIYYFTFINKIKKLIVSNYTQ